MDAAQRQHHPPPTAPRLPARQHRHHALPHSRQHHPRRQHLPRPQERPDRNDHGHPSGAARTRATHRPARRHRPDERPAGQHPSAPVGHARLRHPGLVSVQARLSLHGMAPKAHLQCHCDGLHLRYPDGCTHLPAGERQRQLHHRCRLHLPLRPRFDQETESRPPLPRHPQPERRPRGYGGQ